MKSIAVCLAVLTLSAAFALLGGCCHTTDVANPGPHNNPAADGKNGPPISVGNPGPHN